MKDKETKNVRMDTHENNCPAVCCCEVSAMHDYSSIPDNEREKVKLTYEYYINEQLYEKRIISKAMYEIVKNDLEKRIARGVISYDE